MIVVCISEVHGITIGRTYDVKRVETGSRLHGNVYNGKPLYIIDGDDGKERLFSEKCVKDISKIREEKINILGI